MKAMVFFFSGLIFSQSSFAQSQSLRLEKHNSPSQIVAKINLSVGTESSDQREFWGVVYDGKLEIPFQIVIVATDEFKSMDSTSEKEKLIPLYQYQNVWVGKVEFDKTPYPYQMAIEKALEGKNVYFLPLSAKKTTNVKPKIFLNPLDGMGESVNSPSKDSTQRLHRE